MVGYRIFPIEYTSHNLRYNLRHNLRYNFRYPTLQCGSVIDRIGNANVSERAANHRMCTLQSKLYPLQEWTHAH